MSPIKLAFFVTDFGSKSTKGVYLTFIDEEKRFTTLRTDINHAPMFVERKVHYSALFTYLVGWHAGAVSFPQVTSF